MTSADAMMNGRDPIFALMQGDFKDVIADKSVEEAVNYLYDKKTEFNKEGSEELRQDTTKSGPINESFRDFFITSNAEPDSLPHYVGLFTMLKEADFSKDAVATYMETYLPALRQKHGGPGITDSELDEMQSVIAEALEQVYSE